MVSRRPLLALVATGLLLSAGTAKAETAVLKALNKVSAQVAQFEVPVDELLVFGTLRVVVRSCLQQDPEEGPERMAYIEIDDYKPRVQRTEPVFRGWMLATSPAVSALDHPVYDLWLEDCVN